MGSSPRPDLVSRSALARTLQVTTRTVTNWIRDGILEPIYLDRRVWFRTDDVEALRESAIAKDPDLPSVARQARMAYAASHRAERRLEEILELFGLNRQTLPLDETSIQDLFLAARRLVNGTAAAPPAAVRFWASKFFAMDEQYISLLHRMHPKEPWLVYFELGEKLAGDTGVERATVERHNFAYLEAARDRLRQIVYFYLRRTRGAHAAERAVPHGDGGVTDRILGLMYLP
jgi:hypothetical protein